MSEQDEETLTEPEDDPTGDLLVSLFWQYNAVLVDEEGEAHIVGRPIVDE